MSEKRIHFQQFRYHLLPITNNSNQVKLFNDKVMTIEELKEAKNDFFMNALLHLDHDARSKGNPCKLIDHNDKDYFLFKIANKKSTTITQDFKPRTIDNEPYVYLIINNHKDVQKMAISFNDEAFTSPEVVKNLLMQILNKTLEYNRLNIQIEPLFDKVEFWKYIKDHRDSLTQIDFKYVKPNMANISGALPKAFKDFSELTNSHESHVVIKAPEKGILENIDANNSDIKGLVDYVSQGAGVIKMKVKGLRKLLSTDRNIVTQEIDEISIEGAPDQLIKIYKSIVDE